MRIFRTLLVAAGLLGGGGTAQADITVGVVTALSGSTASIGIPYGRGIAVGMATIGEVAGQRIRLIQLDDQSDPSAASRNARKLIEEDHVDILIGSASAPSSLGMVGISAEQGVPFIIIANALVAGERGAWTLTVPQPASLMVAADRRSTCARRASAPSAISASATPGAIWSTTRSTAPPAPPASGC